tara:strand:+ start:186 stop:584 length:399 start_codon:yes stop_codon:yes gene_type:complete
MFARNIIRNFFNFNTHCARTQPLTFSTSFDHDNAICNHHKYLSQSCGTFNTYTFNEPIDLKHRKMKYVCESQENKYLDLLGRNLCKSVEQDYAKIDEIIDENVFILQPTRCISKEEIDKVIEVLETIKEVQQ